MSLLDRINRKGLRERRSYANERYWLIDLDGSTVGSAFTQRPAAMRHAVREHLGIYDKRLDALILAPNRSERLALLRRWVKNFDDQAMELRTKIARIETIEDD